MGRIFVSAGYEDVEGMQPDSRSALAETIAYREIVTLRDALVVELRSRSLETIVVPDELNEPQVIDWINRRDRGRDVAINIHLAAHPNPTFRGTSVYYIANNYERKRHAELLLLALTRRLPELRIRGALPDTHAAFGSVNYCRQVVPASLYLQLGFVTNPEDRALLEQRPKEIAVGLADGLVTWSRMIAEAGVSATTTNELPPTPIAISLNGRMYGEQGIVVSGNAYLPVDLVDRLGVALNQAAHHRRIAWGNVVYVKAIALRDYNISVSWDSATQTVSLQTVLTIGRESHRITGKGQTSEVQLLMFLKGHNEVGLSQFPDIARLYRDEGSHEGINHDLAFAQMCVETDFLRFSGPRKPGQHNFGGLGAVSGVAEGATFTSTRMGVRAHIQHLKAYANTEPLREEVVDPRFHLITRGIAPAVEELNGRWSPDRRYGDRILAVLRQLYETANLL